MTGSSGKSIVQKLGIKPGFCIFIDGTPTLYETIVGKLPGGAKLAALRRQCLRGELVIVFELAIYERYRAASGAVGVSAVAADLT
jgi:hypothetical protein